MNGIKYSRLLSIAKRHGAIIRHDVDVSLDCAYAMALYELKQGVKAIYYIRVDCDYYNLLSEKSKKIIDFIQEHHFIGIHVDCSKINTAWELINYLDNAQRLIRSTRFTFHVNTDKTRKFGKRIGWYTNDSVISGGYVSDSRHKFDEFKLNDIGNNYTVLIHPEWWVKKGTAKQKIKQCIDEILPKA